LTYHEAFVAQGAREMLASGQWMYPTIGGLPWLEKPPLPWWLSAAIGCFAGGIDERVARLPSALAAFGLVLGVAVLAARHYGPTIGLLAGAVQATTAWTVLRGRLAEADVLLACLVTWSLLSFDEMLTAADDTNTTSGVNSPTWRRPRWVFFGLLGAASLVKGIGFGAVIILSIVAATLLWQRDGTTLRRLWFPPGWLLAFLLASFWPLLMIVRHGTGALTLWLMHVTDRLSGPTGPGPFASEPWWEYVPTVLAQALPWTPLALAGSYRSLRRALSWHARNLGPGDSPIQFQLPRNVVMGDRLLWVWAAVPLALLALATVKNAHYAIAAQIPWSIWAAMALARLAVLLRHRGWSRSKLRFAACAGFASLALLYGVCLWLVAPSWNRRGVEWAFYESVGRSVPPAASITFLYDDWDRLPYECPLGSFPHDLAVRLFYLNRPACWHQGTDALRDGSHIAGCASRPQTESTRAAASADRENADFLVIGRDRDLPQLTPIGRVERLARGPSLRADRSYSLFLISPETRMADSSSPSSAVRSQAPSIGR
jgi:4-amino-4-deoxy-L-arabinose transferase-like glycosyltransferase